MERGRVYAGGKRYLDLAFEVPQGDFDLETIQLKSSTSQKLTGEQTNGHFASDTGRLLPLKKRKLECLRLESDRGCPLERRSGEGGPVPEGRSSCRADRKKSEDKQRPGRGKENRQDKERSLAWWCMPVSLVLGWLRQEDCL